MVFTTLNESYELVIRLEEMSRNINETENYGSAWQSYNMVLNGTRIDESGIYEIVEVSERSESTNDRNLVLEFVLESVTIKYSENVELRIIDDGLA